MTLASALSFSPVTWMCDYLFGQRYGCSASALETTAPHLHFHSTTIDFVLLDDDAAGECCAKAFSGAGQQQCFCAHRCLQAEACPIIRPAITPCAIPILTGDSSNCSRTTLSTGRRQLSSSRPCSLPSDSNNDRRDPRTADQPSSVSELPSLLPLQVARCVGDGTRPSTCKTAPSCYPVSAPGSPYLSLGYHCSGYPITGPSSFRLSDCSFVQEGLSSTSRHLSLALENSMAVRCKRHPYLSGATHSRSTFSADIEFASLGKDGLQELVP